MKTSCFTEGTPSKYFRVRKHNFRRQKSFSFLPVKFTTMLIAMLMLTPSANAQVTIPENAQSNEYGSGWQCKSGFRKEGDACVAIVLPSNAYLTGFSYNKGWACRRGFVEDGDVCLPLSIPANAYLDASGRRWTCNRGYEDNDKGVCALIVVPEHGHLNKNGNGWDCKALFRKTYDSCDPINVPENAFLAPTSYGPGWKCHYGYLEANGRCDLINVSEHGFLTGDPYGDGWSCKRGYKRNQKICVEIIMPQNAHLDYSGNDWECDKPFRKNGSACRIE